MKTPRAKTARRRRSWRQDPAGRRSRILHAASQEFARVGFRAARIDRIATAADVAEGTVYHQFGTKQGLLVAVGEDYGRGLAEAAFGGIGDEPGLHEVEKIVVNLFRHVRETEGSLAAFLLAQDPLEGGPAQDANRSQMLAAIESRLEVWIERGLIAPRDPRLAAELQFGLVEAALRDCFLRRGGADEPRYIAEVTRFLVSYLGDGR